MKRFFASITALLMLLSLAACSSTQTSTAAASQQASTSETGKSENELIAEENDILAANNALWEKVFASMDKNVTDTTLSSNYGDILMNALDHAKDQFTDEEYTALKADADKIREIETQIAALPQDEAASQSMAQTALSLIHISEPTRRTPISYAVFCLKKKKQKHKTEANLTTNLNEHRHHI